jgi:hypothetical protein
VKFTDELTMDLPGRYRHELKLGPQKTPVLAVVNGDRGWQVAGGEAEEMPKARLRELRDEMHVLYLATLAPLRGDERLELELVKGDPVKDRKTAGVKVSCKGRDDVTLHFDAETGMLLKATRPAEVAGVKGVKEYQYGNYKEFGGARLPTHIAEQTDGRKSLEVRSADYQFPRRLDDKSFDKP